MSLEVTSEVKQESALGYDQIVSETAVTTPNLTKTSYQLQEGRSERNLTSENTNNGERIVNSDAKQESERKVKSTTSTAKASVEKANIAFQISFSVPILGRFPAGAPGSNNC